MTSFVQSRRCLQGCVLIAAFVPVLAGLWGVIAGPGMVHPSGLAVDQTLDSHFRYLSGLLLAIGLGFWTTVPHIETKTELFRQLGLIVIVGGFGRAVSVWVLGFPSSGMLFGLGMELVITPLLILWQSRVSVPPPYRRQ